MTIQEILLTIHDHMKNKQYNIHYCLILHCIWFNQDCCIHFLPDRLRILSNMSIMDTQKLGEIEYLDPELFHKLDKVLETT